MVCLTICKTTIWTITDTTYRTGVLCIFLCFALGIANIFHANFVIAFSIVCLYIAIQVVLTAMS